MSHVHLTKEDLVGSCNWKGNLDLLNTIIVGLTRELPEHDETYKLPIFITLKEPLRKEKTHHFEKGTKAYV